MYTEIGMKCVLGHVCTEAHVDIGWGRCVHSGAVHVSLCQVKR